MVENSTLEFLKTRRSVLARNMVEPGPSADVLREILTAATRVPDHGKLAPWRLVVLQEGARAALGKIAADALAGQAEDKSVDAYASSAAQFLRAPCVIAVLACPKAHPKIPRSEMILSAGAVCMTLLTAAQSLGFAAQWLTGDVAYEPAVLQCLGGQAGDEIAGFIYIGTPTQAPSERARPALNDVVQFGLAP
jgi:nitroreductase